MGTAERRQSGTFAVLTSAALFGTTGTVLVNAPSGADPYSVGAIRLLVGAATLAVIAWASRTVGAATPSPRATAVGAVGVAVFQLGYFVAVERTGVAVGTVITIGSGPVISGVVHAMSARRAPSATWLAGTAAGVSGVALLGIAGTADGGASVVDPLGMALAVIAGAGWATFATIGRREIGRGVASSLNMAAMFGGGALLVAPVLVWHSPAWIGSWTGAAIALHLGVLTVGVAYWLYGIALRHLPAPTVITLTLLEPITAAVLGRAVVGEQVTPAGWVGVALVVVGLLVTGRAADRAPGADITPPPASPGDGTVPA